MRRITNEIINERLIGRKIRGGYRINNLLQKIIKENNILSQNQEPTFKQLRVNE